MSNEPQNLKSSEYLDKDSNNGWEWQNDGEKVLIVTRHDHPKEHEHRADVTNVPIGEMVANPDPIIGQAHRNSPHYYKDGKIKPPKNNNNEKDTENMSVDKNKAFRDSQKVDTSKKSTEQSTNTNKKTSNTEGENKGQNERSLPERKSSRNVEKMRTDMKTDPKAKDGKEAKATVAKTQSVSPNGTEGKTANNTNGKTSNSNGSKGGNTIGGKGTTGGKGGVGTGGKGGNTGGGHGGR